jgi:hypothetical protein
LLVRSKAQTGICTLGYDFPCLHPQNDRILLTFDSVPHELWTRLPFRFTATELDRPLVSERRIRFKSPWSCCCMLQSCGAALFLGLRCHFANGLLAGNTPLYPGSIQGQDAARSRAAEAVCIRVHLPVPHCHVGGYER